MVMNYFIGLADEVRGLLSELGVEKLTDLIGRTDLLETIEGLTAKQTKLDLSNILEAPVSPEGHLLYWTQPNTPFDKAELNNKIIEDALQAVEKRQSASFFYNVINTDRSVGARLSGEIAQRYGNQPKGHGGNANQATFGRHSWSVIWRLERRWRRALPHW